MRQQTSVFQSILKLVPWDEFDRAIKNCGAQEAERGFTYRSQLVAMLYAQFAGAVSLREIESSLSSHANRLYHLHATPPKRATLAEANSNRPAAIFAALLGSMIQRAHRKLRQSMDEVTYLIDSTGLVLNALSSHWGRFSANQCGAKLHVVYDPAADCPVYTAFSAANVNDITAAKAMPIVPKASYVFDLGYYDYAWWAELDAAECRFVTRLKKNTHLTVTRTQPVAPGGAILSDRIGYLPARQSKNRRNPFSKEVREVQVRIPTGKVLRILTNDLKAPAQEIANLYKLRWAIELFFRWVKQTLKIKKFLGVSENAVRIQIAVALIAFLLLRLAQRTQTAISSPLMFARLVKANLMHLRGFAELDRPPQRGSSVAGQGVLF
ncbi:MAG TPA: IS4 family transposase [Rhodopila sp.]